MDRLNSKEKKNSGIRTNTRAEQGQRGVEEIQKAEGVEPWERNYWL